MKTWLWNKIRLSIWKAIHFIFFSTGRLPALHCFPGLNIRGLSFTDARRYDLDEKSYILSSVKVLIISQRLCACVRLWSCLTFCDPMDCSLPSFLCPWDFPGKNTGVGCHALRQGIFPTQGSNSCLLCSLQLQTGSLLLVPPGKPSKNAQVL